MRNPLIIKVCGMMDKENIMELAKLPIQYVGHIFYPRSPRYAEQLENWKPIFPMKKTGVFVNDNLEDILARVAQFQLSAVQLHGEESAELCAQLQNQGLEVIKAFGIHQGFDWNTLASYSQHVDYFLFDSKSSNYGGTGQTFGWGNLKAYPLQIPYFLSGGLSLENLKEALGFQDDRMIGLDLNSRFEISPGIKDIEKIKVALKVINNE